MEDFIFVMPAKVDDLLRADYDSRHYAVGDVLIPSELNKEVKAAQDALRELGPAFILHHFDTYYSILKQYTDLPRVVVHNAFKDLEKSLRSMPSTLNCYMEDEELITDAVRREVQNMLKMTAYLYVNLFQCLEHSFIDDSLLEKDRRQRKSINESALLVDWAEVISALKMLFQIDLNKFWDHLVVEDSFLNKVMELTVTMLEDTRIKRNKEALPEMWAFFGLLINGYHASDALIIRLGRVAKDYDYAVALIADGVQHLVEVFQAKAFLTAFVAELTEWQMQDTNVESSAAKNCARLVMDLAARLPSMLHEMLESLWKFLRADSHQLRAMVLGVMVEVVQVGVHRKDALTEKEVEQWNVLHTQILDALALFTHDSAMYVRSRTFGFIKRLVAQNCVTYPMPAVYLRKAIAHLTDIAAPVRKAAANCVTALLQYNAFGPNLPLSKLQAEYDEKRAELSKLKYEVYGLDLAKQEELEREWQTHLPFLQAELQRLADLRGEVSVDGDNADQTIQTDEVNDHNKTNGNVTHDDGVAAKDTNGSDEQRVRDEIVAKNYKAAVAHCCTASTTSALWRALSEKLDSISLTGLYVCYMRIAFSNVSVDVTKMPTQEELDKLSKCESGVEYHADVVQFLEAMRSAMDVMCDMLNSATIGDMHEAVAFIVAAKKFQLDDASKGIDALLNIMRRNEEDRRRVAGEALRSIYLMTDSTQLKDHTSEVSENLLSLYRNVSSASSGALTQLISTWTKEGTIGNDIIDILWDHFLQKVQTTPQKSRIALILLGIAGIGRPTIITRNYQIVASTCFRERGATEPLLVVEGMKFLRLLSSAFPNTDNEPAFRIKRSDDIWRHVSDVLKHYRRDKSPVVHKMLSAAVQLIFALHAHPFKFTESLLHWFSPFGRNEAPNSPNAPENPGKTSASVWCMIRYNLFVGEVAMATLVYLDTDVYREMKRRRMMKRGKKKGQHAPLPVNLSAVRQKRAMDSLNTTVQSAAGSEHEHVPAPSDFSMDESVLEGVDAIDEDADLITHVLEHSLDQAEAMGKMYAPVMRVCRNLRNYPNEVLQVSAASALARGMMVSTTWCEAHVQLLFTILLKAQYAQVKVTSLIHIVDLIDRCPNAVEPYTPKLYSLLEDESLSVRQVALNTISLLILKDMIRPQGDIWRLAVCLIDPEPAICRTARAFFLQTTSKSNNLYNYLPDIFMHLCVRYPRDSNDKENANHAREAPPIDANEEHFRLIIRYLFSLIDKARHVEVLVERFCLKFDNADDEQAKRIAFTISLMQLSEKALQILIENFPRYRHFVLVDEVYSWMKVVCAAAKGKGLKGLTTQLEDLLKEMFVVDGRPPRNVFKKPAAPRRKPKANAVGKKARGRPRVSASADNSSDSEEDESPNRRRRSTKGRRGSYNWMAT